MNELPDNEGLEPILAGNCILGLYPEINGSDAVACPEYVPTRHELLQLARHWYGTLLGIQVDWFFTHQSGSYEYRILLYAERRLDRIIEAIGREAVEKVATEVDAGYRERMGGRLGCLHSRWKRRWVHRVADRNTHAREARLRAEGRPRNMKKSTGKAAADSRTPPATDTRLERRTQ